MGLPLEMTPNYEDFSCQVGYVYCCHLVVVCTFCQHAIVLSAVLLDENLRVVVGGFASGARRRVEHSNLSVVGCCAKVVCVPSLNAKTSKLTPPAPARCQPQFYVFYRQAPPRFCAKNNSTWHCSSCSSSCCWILLVCLFVMLYNFLRLQWPRVWVIGPMCWGRSK